MKTNKQGLIKCHLCNQYFEHTTGIKSQMGNKWIIELCDLCRGDLFREIQYQIILEQTIELIDKKIK